jgi:hypothetical protein
MSFRNFRRLSEIAVQLAVTRVPSSGVDVKDGIHI